MEDNVNFWPACVLSVCTHMNIQASLKVRCTPEKQGLIYRAEPAHIGSHRDHAGKHRARARSEPDRVPVVRQEVDLCWQQPTQNKLITLEVFCFFFSKPHRLFCLYLIVSVFTNVCVSVTICVPYAFSLALCFLSYSGLLLLLLLLLIYLFVF